MFAKHHCTADHVELCGIIEGVPPSNSPFSLRVKPSDSLSKYFPGCVQKV